MHLCFLVSSLALEEAGAPSVRASSISNRHSFQDCREHFLLTALIDFKLSIKNHTIELKCEIRQGNSVTNSELG